MRKFFKNQLGFTLLELLVVIAIIGILSAVVMAALSNARTKAKDTAVAANLDTARKQIEIYYDSKGSFGAFPLGSCPTAPPSPAPLVLVNPVFWGDPVVLNAINTAKANGLNSAVSARCQSTANAWAVAITLKNGTASYCADSRGVVKKYNGIASAALTGNARCN